MSSSSVRNASLSRALTVLIGTRVILATISSMSRALMVFCAVSRAQHLRGTHLVDHVDRLVRQLAVVDVAGRQLHRGVERAGGVAHLVVRLEAAAAVEDLDRLVLGGLGMSIFWKRRTSARSFSK